MDGALNNKTAKAVFLAIFISRILALVFLVCVTVGVRYDVLAHTRQRKTNARILVDIKH